MRHEVGIEISFVTIPPEDLIGVSHRRIDMLQITTGTALLLALEVDVPGTDSQSRQSPMVSSDKGTQPSIGACTYCPFLERSR